MSILRFSDGMTINTDGPLRVIRKSDGYYVVGNGMCLPVGSRAEGQEYIREIEQREIEQLEEKTSSTRRWRNVVVSVWRHR